MRLVVRSGPGQVELNYMWLPTWIGMNEALLKEIEKALAPVLVGKDLDDGTLEEAHFLVLDYLKERFSNINGLFDYLDGMKYVVIDEGRQATSSVGAEPGDGHQGVR
jgi:hypothetical protein